MVVMGLTMGSWSNPRTLSPQPLPRLGVTFLTPPSHPMGFDDSLSAVEEDSLPCAGLGWVPGVTEG